MIRCSIGFFNVYLTQVYNISCFEQLVPSFINFVFYAPTFFTRNVNHEETEFPHKIYIHVVVMDGIAYSDVGLSADKCFCGDILNGSAVANMSSCNVTCPDTKPGSPYYCGGPGHLLSVYLTSQYNHFYLIIVCFFSAGDIRVASLFFSLPFHILLL